MSFNFLPDDTELTPEQDLEAAAAGALALPEDLTPSSFEPLLPFGKTWIFDFEERRFIWTGTSPTETRGFGALEQWCLMALHSERFAHAVFSDEFGMEGINDPLGEFAEGEVLADWERHLTEALLVHDRVSAIENIDLTWDPSEGILYVNNFDVVTDEEQRLTLGDIAIQRSSA